MEIDLPEVVAEVRDAFDRYEKALVGNDVTALNAFFRDDPRTIRYGGGENLYGYDEIKAFRAARSPVGLGPQSCRHRYHHLRPRLRGCLDAVRARLDARQDRPANANLGQVSRRLARGRGPCQPDRSVQCLAKSFTMSVTTPVAEAAWPRRTLAEELRLQLADEIVRGTLAPGTALDETLLARRFQVSRTPVREAIRHARGERARRGARASRGAGGAPERASILPACSR